MEGILRMQSIQIGSGKMSGCCLYFVCEMKSNGILLCALWYLGDLY